MKMKSSIPDASEMSFLKKIYRRYFGDFVFFDRIERVIVIKWLEPKQKEKILDVGSGLGNTTRKIAKKGAYAYGIDNFPRNIEISKNLNPGKYFLQDAGHLHFKSAFFDKAISTSTLEHIRNIHKVFKEVSRVLKRNGVYVFSVDSMSYPGVPESFKRMHSAETGIPSYLNYEKIKNELRKTGFSIEKSEYLFKTKLSSSLQLWGLKLIRKRINQPLIFLSFFIAYPLCKIADFFGREEGNVLVVKARKN